MGTLRIAFLKRQLNKIMYDGQKHLSLFKIGSRRCLSGESPRRFLCNCLPADRRGSTPSVHNKTHVFPGCNIVVDSVSNDGTILIMIKSFKHKGLAELFEQGRTRRIQQSLQSRCLRRLDALDQTESLKDLNVPGFNFHGLQGTPERYTIHVNGPWCITFEWNEGEALRVNLEQYH